ncbi:hypothetical protein TNCV_4573551 [Trichonephila clavipes]|nr:hypothetical protein TNCV_4573551 [Trichonephila clavipes]
MLCIDVHSINVNPVQTLANLPGINPMRERDQETTFGSLGIIDPPQLKNGQFDACQWLSISRNHPSHWSRTPGPWI